MAHQEAAIVELIQGTLKLFTRSIILVLCFCKVVKFGNTIYFMVNFIF